MEELLFKKKGKLWQCSDRDGNSCTAPTKDMARNQYYLLYGISREPQGFGVDINKYNKGI